MSSRADGDELTQERTRAADPSTPPEVLRALAWHDELDVRRAVAGNPSTPRAVIDAMLAKPGSSDERQPLIDAVMGNASLPLWLLDDPAWMQRPSWPIARMMARSPALTPAGWEALLGHESDGMTAALLSSAVAPSDAWRRCGLASELDALRLVLDDDEETNERLVEVKLLGHPGLAARLRAEPDWLRRGTPRAARVLAGSPRLTPWLWQALCGHQDERTRLALLRSPLAPPDAWTQLGLPSTGSWDLAAEELDGVDLCDLAQRPQLEGLMGLSVRSSLPEALGALLRSPFLTGLTSLVLCHYDMTQEVMTALSEGVFHERLLSLDLSHNRLGVLSPESLESLASLRALVSLDLSNGELSDGHLEHLIGVGRLASVTALNLAKNRLTSGCMDLLDRWASRARPHSLGLSENRLGDGGVASLARSASFATLASLDLSFNEVSHEGAAALARSTNLSSLTSLELQSNRVGDEGAVALARSPAMSRLTHLGLGGSSIGPLGAAALAASTRLANLVSLDLLGNPLGDEGVSALCQSTTLTGLRTLDLSDTGVGLAGMEALAEARVLAGLTSLQLFINRRLDDACMAVLARARWMREVTSLVLSDTAIGDAGLEALARSEAFPRLEYLELSYTSISDRGLLALAQSTSLPSLRELNILSCRETKEGVAALARASFHFVRTPWPGYLFRRGLEALPGTALTSRGLTTPGRLQGRHRPRGDGRRQAARWPQRRRGLGAPRRPATRGRALDAPSGYSPGAW